MTVGEAREIAQQVSDWVDANADSLELSVAHSLKAQCNTVEADATAVEEASGFEEVAALAELAGAVTELTAEAAAAGCVIAA